MTDPRGWGLSEQHLLPDVVVAFVDGELSMGARDRAAAHMIRCPLCTAEILTQRQARAAVRSADVPGMSAGLLASLRAIPDQVELPDTPDELAVTDDGQLVAVQRPDRRSERFGGRPRFGSGPTIGSSPRLGGGSAVLGRGRRTAQGAGVVVSGLVLGALAFVTPSDGAPGEQPRQGPGTNRPPVAADEPLDRQAGLIAPEPAPDAAVRSAIAPVFAPVIR